MKKIILLAISTIFQFSLHAQEHFEQELTLHKFAIQLPRLSKQAEDQQRLSNDLSNLVARIPELKDDQNFLTALSKANEGAYNLTEKLLKADEQITGAQETKYQPDQVANLVKKLKQKESIDDANLCILKKTITDDMLQPKTPEPAEAEIARHIQTLVPEIKKDLALYAKTAQEYLQEKSSVLLPTFEIREILNLTNIDEVNRQPDDCIFDTIKRINSKLDNLIDHLNKIDASYHYYFPDTADNYLKDLREHKSKIIDFKQQLAQLAVTKETTICTNLEKLINDLKNKKVLHAQFNQHLDFLKKKKEELKELKAGVAPANVKPELKAQLGTALKVVDECIESHTHKMRQFKKNKKTTKCRNIPISKSEPIHNPHPTCKIPIEPLRASDIEIFETNSNNSHLVLEESFFLKKKDGSLIEVNRLIFIPDSTKKISAEQANKKNAKKSLKPCDILNFKNGEDEECVEFEMKDGKPTIRLAHTPGGEYYMYPKNEDFAYKISKILGYYQIEVNDSD